MPSGGGGGGAAAAAGGAAAAADEAPKEEEKEEEKEESDEDVILSVLTYLMIRWVSDCSIRVPGFMSINLIVTTLFQTFDPVTFAAVPQFWLLLGSFSFCSGSAELSQFVRKRQLLLDLIMPLTTRLLVKLSLSPPVQYPRKRE